MGQARQRKLAPDLTPPVSCMPDDIKVSIALIARNFTFTAADSGGTCLARSVIGKAVLDLCGLPARIVSGGMLYRAGSHRVRDTLRFSMDTNQGGYIHGALCGHVWNEADGDIIDFSAGDWVDEAENLC